MRRDYAASWPIYYIARYFLLSLAIAPFFTALVYGFTSIYASTAFFSFFEYVKAVLDPDLIAYYSPTTPGIKVYRFDFWWERFDWEVAQDYFKKLNFSSVGSELKRILWCNYCAVKLGALSTYNFMVLDRRINAPLIYYNIEYHPDILDIWGL